MDIFDLKARKIGIVGLGVNNRYLGKYLRDKGVGFEVIDNWKTPEELVGKLDHFDLIFRTPGLPYLSAAVTQAKQKGATIYSQTKLFFDLCPAKIIGVTGTKGKGTTATLIHNILKVAGKKVYLAGNIGFDPFQFLDQLKTDDLVVLELSSFQLQDLHKSPHVAVVLNIISEHLDYHADTKEYIDAKKSIVRYQTKNDFAVLNLDSPVVKSFANQTSAQIVWNSTESPVNRGSYLADGAIMVNFDGVKGEAAQVKDIKLLGKFNLENVTAAVAASLACGVRDLKQIQKSVKEFRGLPHRLEFVGEFEKVKYYNDSASTTPETTLGALGAISSPVILIAGGSEKNADYFALAADIVARKVKALIAIGVTGKKIAGLARSAGYKGQIHDDNYPDMESIVKKAREIAKAGDAVLLSPGSASFDMFKNYEHRGELFKKFVKTP